MAQCWFFFILTCLSYRTGAELHSDIHFADGGHLSGENTDVFLMDPVQEDILVIPLLPEEDSHAVEVVGAVEIVEQHVVEIQPASPGNEAANADIEDPYGKPRKKKTF